MTTEPTFAFGNPVAVPRPFNMNHGAIARPRFAVFAPAAAQNLVDAILVPLWLVVPAVIVTVIRRRISHRDDQSVALLSLALFRAPPAHVALT